MTSLLVGCETVLYMANRLKAYMDFLHRLPATLPRTNFESAVTKLYAEALCSRHPGIAECDAKKRAGIAEQIWHSIFMQTNRPASSQWEETKVCMSSIQQRFLGVVGRAEESGPLTQQSIQSIAREGQELLWTSSQSPTAYAEPD
jgi:hypothetical protein